MYPDDLSPEAEAILAEITSYHRRNLENVQRELQRKRDLGNRGTAVSLARALTQMRAPAGLRNSPEAEFFETVAKLGGLDYDPQRIVVPWGLLRRDLNAVTANQAGYLVATETRDVIDLLRPFSVTARLGVTIETSLMGDQVIPQTTQKTTPQWLNTEAASVTPSQPTLSQIAVTPKQVGAVVNFSRQLAQQANAEAYVRRELLRTVGTAIDQASIAGSGASGQPTGLLLTSGLQTETGTSLAHVGTANMKKKAADANVDDERIAFLATPAVREILEKRERATGSGFIWENDRVADRRAYVSTDVPAATMICGDWSNVYIGLWGPGLVVEINPFDPSGFKAGTIQARLIVSCDVCALHPGSFVKAESIT